MSDAYDAGLLNDWGGGNVEWWQDYIRAELERSHEFYAAEITRLRAQVEAADRLAEAVTGLVSILDQNETKGPISDVQLMFCWLAAQDVRAAAKGAKAK